MIAKHAEQWLAADASGKLYEVLKVNYVAFVLCQEVAEKSKYDIRYIHNNNDLALFVPNTTGLQPDLIN